MSKVTMDIEGLDEIANFFEVEAKRLRERAQGVTHPVSQYDYTGQANGYEGAARYVRKLLRRMQERN